MGNKYLTPEAIKSQYGDSVKFLSSRFDTAIVGVTRYRNEVVVLYDYYACIDVITSIDVTIEDAVFYLEFYIHGNGGAEDRRSRSHKGDGIAFVYTY